MMKSKLVATLVLLVIDLSFATAPRSFVSQSVGASAHRSPIRVGEMAPDFTLQDQQGRGVKLSAARGKTPVVLVF